MIGNRIKLARAARGKTQQWLAEEVGVKQSNVSAWERGEKDPATENLSRTAQALDVSFEWLATGRGEMDTVYHPVIIKQADPLPQYESYSAEQREFLQLFDALPRKKREILLTFMRDWVEQ